LFFSAKLKKIKTAGLVVDKSTSMQFSHGPRFENKNTII
jgi:hypothetical protein